MRVGYSFRYVFHSFTIHFIIEKQLIYFISGNELLAVSEEGGNVVKLMFRYIHESTETKINEEWSAANARTEWLINFDSAMRHAARERNAKNWSEVNAASGRGSYHFVQ